MTKDEATRSLRRAELECAIARGKLAQAEINRERAEAEYLEAEEKVDKWKAMLERYAGGTARGPRAI